MIIVSGNVRRLQM